jgi:hypothetical protein
MIGARLNVEQFKRGFFDRAIMSRVPKAKRAALSKFGGRVRKRAQRSIRKNRKGVSAPGNPPFSHGRHLLRTFLFYAYDASSESVVVGPAKLSEQIGNAPEALEEGGESIAVVWSGKRGSRKRQRQKIQLKPRPYMAPAFAAELPQASKDFKDTIR